MTGEVRESLRQRIDVRVRELYADEIARLKPTPRVNRPVYWLPLIRLPHGDRR